MLLHDCFPISDSFIRLMFLCMRAEKTLTIPFSSIIWFDSINFGWLNVHIKGSQVRISKFWRISVPETYFNLTNCNSTDPDEMPHYVVPVYWYPEWKASTNPFMSWINADIKMKILTHHGWTNTLALCKLGRKKDETSTCITNQFMSWINADIEMETLTHHGWTNALPHL